MVSREEATKEYQAAIAKCREVLVAVAGNRRQCGPIATHAQTALNQLEYAEGLLAALSTSDRVEPKS